MERAINKNHKTLLKKIKNLPGEHAQWSLTIKCQFRQTNLKRKKEKYKTMPNGIYMQVPNNGTMNFEYKIIHGALTSKQETKFKAQITLWYVSSLPSVPIVYNFF
jgi:hypothetical protein